MSKRHLNHLHVKVHRNYTVEEIANRFGIHKNTVRNWQKNGLATIDDRKPMLFYGQTLATYLQANGQRTSGHASQVKFIASAAVLRKCQPVTWRSISQ